MEPGTRNREQQGRVIASQALFPVPPPRPPAFPCSRRCYHVPVITEGWADHLAGPFGIAFAFAAGVISFLSPCVLPLVPAYIAHLRGVPSPPEATAGRRETLSHAFAFVLGFGVVFTVIGASVRLVGGPGRGEMPTLG